MRIYPAIHYTMGGLWVDYNLMSTIPGLHVLGEANFSDHGANRLGASALMQGLADGYFVIPYTIGNYLGEHAAAEGHDRSRRVQGGGERRAGSASTSCWRSRAAQTSARSHRELGAHPVGRRRHGAHRGRACARALERDSASCATSSGRTSRCRATPNNLNQSLEYAGRVADYLEFAELLALDALHRTRIVRRPLPRGEPDARRRGAARRRALLVRGGLGVQGRRQAAGAAQGAARVRGSAPDAAELQVSWQCSGRSEE